MPMASPRLNIISSGGCHLTPRKCQSFQNSWKKKQVLDERIRWWFERKPYSTVSNSRPVGFLWSPHPTSWTIPPGRSSWKLEKSLGFSSLHSWRQNGWHRNSSRIWCWRRAWFTKITSWAGRPHVQTNPNPLKFQTCHSQRIQIYNQHLPKKKPREFLYPPVNQWTNLTKKTQQ